MKNWTARHGDVLIERVEKLPENIKPAKRDKGKIVLAYGEVTGHSHAIIEKTAKAFVSGDALYLDLEKAAKVEHEEHGTIVLEPAIYLIHHQIEYRRKKLVKTQD